MESRIIRLEKFSILLMLVFLKRLEYRKKTCKLASTKWFKSMRISRKVEVIEKHIEFSHG